MSVISLHASATTDSVSRLYINTYTQQEHAVDHGHKINTFQHGLLAYMLHYARIIHL